MSIKHFIFNSITSNPERYAIDGGDLHLINDYFTAREWQPLTKEQHTTIANLIRGRITALKDNPLDMRKRFKPKEHHTESDIYAVIGDATIETYGTKTGDEVEIVLSYFGQHPRNAKRHPSLIKQSIYGQIEMSSIKLSQFIFSVCSKKDIKKAFARSLQSNTMKISA